MLTATNFLLVLSGFISICVGVVLYKKRALLVTFLCIGLLLAAYPFVDHYIATRGAYDWTIVVDRTINRSGDTKVIFIRSIQWITDYESINGWRGETRSALLNEDKTNKEWHVKGYKPISIVANILYGASKYRISRNFRSLDAGSYTFALTFDENDVGTWSIEENIVETDEKS